MKYVRQNWSPHTVRLTQRPEVADAWRGFSRWHCSLGRYRSRIFMLDTSQDCQSGRQGWEDAAAADWRCIDFGLDNMQMKVVTGHATCHVIDTGWQLVPYLIVSPPWLIFLIVTVSARMNIIVAWLMATVIILLLIFRLLHICSKSSNECFETILEWWAP